MIYYNYNDNDDDNDDIILTHLWYSFSQKHKSKSNKKLMFNGFSRLLTFVYTISINYIAKLLKNCIH